MASVEFLWTDTNQEQGSGCVIQVPGNPDNAALLSLAGHILADLGGPALGLTFGVPPYHLHEINVKTESRYAVDLS